MDWPVYLCITAIHIPHFLSAQDELEDSHSRGLHFKLNVAYSKTPKIFFFFNNRDLNMILSFRLGSEQV